MVRRRVRRRVVRPAAARIWDGHLCGQKEPVPHVGGPIVEGCETVLIGKENAAAWGTRRGVRGVVGRNHDGGADSTDR